MSDLLIDLPDNKYEVAASDLQSNEKDLETRGNQAADLKYKFDELIFRLRSKFSKDFEEVTATESSFHVKPNLSLVYTWC